MTAAPRLGGVAGDRWYKNAVVYSMSVAHFFDFNDDGIGDLRGAARRLDYVVSLGCDCVWLLPITPSPMRDLGYDVADFYGVRPELGHLGDFAAFVRLAHERGLRVVIDLSLHHTSIDHPWFQEARRDHQSRFRDFYIWADERPPQAEWPEQVVFEEDGDGPWTFDEQAKAWYLHHYYWHEPDLNLTNPDVRDELHRVLGFWLELGVDGVRIDSATLLSEQAAPSYDGDRLAFLRELRSTAASHDPAAVFLVEADVKPEQLGPLFSGSDGGILLLNFYLANFLWLALARESAGPLRDALTALPSPSHVGHWANFLRNHDELDLEQLSESEREEVFEAFAPDPDMRVYGRGIRRRLAPMLDGDERRLRLAFSLLLAMPGAPILLYGDELGMGDMLSLSERRAVRIAMQWSAGETGGFCRPGVEPQVPVQTDGPFSSDHVSVGGERAIDGSLLNWVASALRIRRASSAIGWGEPECRDGGSDSVFVIAHRHDTEVLVAAHNLAATDACAELGELREAARIEEVFADQEYGDADDTSPLRLAGYGYRWFRVEQQGTVGA